MQDGNLLPRITDISPVPEYLLEAIHCGYKRRCHTPRCFFSINMDWSVLLRVLGAMDYTVATS